MSVKLGKPVGKEIEWRVWMYVNTATELQISPLVRNLVGKNTQYGMLNIVRQSIIVYSAKFIKA